MSGSSKGLYVKTKWVLVSITTIVYITAFAFLFIFSVVAGPRFAQRDDLANSGKDDGDYVVNSGENEEEIVIPQGYKQYVAEKGDMNFGDLILVTNDHACAFEGENLVSLLENADDTYFVADYQVMINSNLVENLNNMLSDFYDIYGIKEVLVNSAYRSKEVQQSIYEKEIANSSEDESSQWVAKPGYSEHQTGMAFDLSLFINNAVLDYDGEKEYAWINENCYKYGFVVRYQTDKIPITGIGNEPWHFRYVGVVHAEYMYKNDLCLEEYTDLLKNYSVNKPLSATDFNSESYKIYYVKASKDNTVIPVPKDNKYAVSGNNVDGFVVTETLSTEKSPS